jgi:hypothetical protein
VGSHSPSVAAHDEFLHRKFASVTVRDSQYPYSERDRCSLSGGLK